jgi:uncharacterized protein YciI
MDLRLRARGERLMLGPFFDRDGVKTSPERWARLVDSESYGEVATSNFPPLGVTVRTIWLGHDPADGSPPKVFVTRVSGDADMQDTATASLNDSRNAHAETCARYTAQTILLAAGGSSALMDGVL